MLLSNNTKKILVVINYFVVDLFIIVTYNIYYFIPIVTIVFKSFLLFGYFYVICINLHII